MRNLFAILALSVILSCGTETLTEPPPEPPLERQCQQAELCDCYELKEGWWQYRACVEPEEDTGCDVPPAEAPGWGKLGRSEPQMRDVIEAAKADVGERCGESPLNTLQLVVDALLQRGVCAAVRTDAVFAQIGPGTYEEWHSVAYTDGCWYGPAFKGTWYFGG